MHLGFIHFSAYALYFMTLKSFRNILAELKSRLKEKTGLIKEKNEEELVYSYKI